MRPMFLYRLIGLSTFSLSGFMNILCINRLSLCNLDYLLGTRRLAHSFTGHMNFVMHVCMVVINDLWSTGNRDFMNYWGHTFYQQTIIEKLVQLDTTAQCVQALKGLIRMDPCSQNGGHSPGGKCEFWSMALTNTFQTILLCITRLLLSLYTVRPRVYSIGQCDRHAAMQVVYVHNRWSAGRHVSSS